MSAASTVLASVNTALATGARRYASPALAADGFVVVPQFLAADDVEAIMADVRRFGERSVKATGNRSTALRDRGDRQDRDRQVRQLMNVDRISPAIDTLVRSGRVQDHMSSLIGTRLTLGAMTLQIDWPDTDTKRGLHADSHWPVTYKALVYLTSVQERENGPFCAVPGSHRDRVRKIRAVIGNARAGRKLTDLDHVYRLADARALTGDAGTAIFSDQRLAHAGWPGHTTGTRFMLSAYFYRPGTSIPRFLI